MYYVIHGGGASLFQIELVCNEAKQVIINVQLRNCHLDSPTVSLGGL